MECFQEHAQNKTADIKYESSSIIVPKTLQMCTSSEICSSISDSQLSDTYEKIYQLDVKCSTSRKPEKEIVTSE